MAEGTSLTKADYSTLVEQLRAQADESGALGERKKERDYRKAAEAVRLWLEEDAERPEEVLGRYGHLIGLETSTPIEPPVSTPTEISLITDGEAAELETELDRTAERELRQAESYLEQGLAGSADALRQAVALSRHLVNQPQPLAEAQEIYARAQNELNHRLQEALEAGNTARHEGNMAEAEDHYNTALTYDPDNSQARNALLGLDESAAAELDKDQLAGLRRGLKERRDLTVLGDAVYKAEFLDAENKLTPELAGLLAEARQFYDETRRLQGAETTMMRFGDLTARKEARDQIEKRVSDGERVIFDVTTNTMRPSHDVLEEANELYRRRSEETAQHEIGRVNQALPAYPRGALQRLVTALEEPFQEEQRQLLERKKDEIDYLIQAENQAEVLLKDAAQSDEPVNRLRLVLQAYDVFPHIPGLGEKLRQERETTGELLAVRINDMHNLAKSLVGRREFDEANNQIAQAEIVAATWPEEKKPARLEALIETGKQLRQEINQEAQRLHDFEQQVEQIRQRVANPAMRQAGMALLEQLDQNKRFNTLPEYNSLRVEMDQYRDIGGKLTEARQARARGEWQRVHDLSGDILNSGKAGQFEEEVEELFRLSAIELKITQAQGLLLDFDFSAADKILKQLLRDSPKEKEALQERLQKELAQIEDARQGNKTMRDLIRRARQLAAESDERYQAEALEMFRYIAGDHVEASQGSWPDFVLSFHTSAARSEAVTLRQIIREALVPELKEQFSHLSQKEDAGKVSINKSQLALLADRARLLRDGRLLDNEEERAAARWFILYQGRLDAEARQAIDDWEGAVNIWQNLDDHYPRFVDQELRQARIQYALYQADQLLRDGNSEQAVRLLLETLNERGLTQSWELLLKLAELHAHRGEFQLAFDAVARAARLNDEQAKAEVEKTRAWLIRERDIQEMLQKARQEEHQIGDSKEALRILQNGLQSERTAGSERLLRERDRLFDQMVVELRRQADERKRSGTVEDKVEAVVALVDLRELEDLLGIPASERRSDQELEPLRDELQPGAESVIDNATTKFHPEFQPLDEGIRRAGELVGRLQTFSRVLPLIGQDNNRLQVDLAQTQKDLGETLDRLKELRTILQEANEMNRWQEALITDNFSELEQYRQRMRRLGFGRLVDVEEFETKLDEWQAVNNHLLEAVQTIRQAFVQDEDFSRARQILRDVVVRPDVRPDNKARWRQVQQKDYDDIRQFVQHKLIIQDSYQGALTGWEPVDEVAADRQSQLEAWQTWESNCARLIDKTWTSREIALSNSENAPRTKVRADWQTVIDNAEEALALLETGPTLNDEAVEVRSRKARTIRDEGSRREALVRETLSAAYRNQPDHKQFPSPQEFSNAARSIPLLESVVKNARAIGPGNEDEQQRLTYYEGVLVKLKNKSSSPFWRRIFGR